MIFSKFTYEEDSLFLVSGRWLFTTQVSCRETPRLTLEAKTLFKATHTSHPCTATTSCSEAPAGSRDRFAHPAPGKALRETPGASSLRGVTADTPHHEDKQSHWNLASWSPSQTDGSQVSVEQFIRTLWGSHGCEVARDPSGRAPAAQHLGESLAPTSQRKRRIAPCPTSPKCFTAIQPGLTASFHEE